VSSRFGGGWGIGGRRGPPGWRRPGRTDPVRQLRRLTGPRLDSRLPDRKCRDRRYRPSRSGGDGYGRALRPVVSSRFSGRWGISGRRGPPGWRRPGGTDPVRQLRRPTGPAWIAGCRTGSVGTEGVDRRGGRAMATAVPAPAAAISCASGSWGTVHPVVRGGPVDRRRPRDRRRFRKSGLRRSRATRFRPVGRQHAFRSVIRPGLAGTEPG
jgi:hypothetical protein